MINAISQIVKTTTWSAIFLCLFCISPHLQAQESKMRSWLNDWQNTTLPDSVRFEAIDKLVMKGYRITNSDSALFYVDKQLAFAKGEKNKKWIAEALSNKGRILLSVSGFSAANATFQEALEIQESIGDIKGMADTYQWIGYVLRKEGKLTEALDYYQLSLDRSSQLGEEGRTYTAATLNGMGTLYLDQKNYEKALEYYQQSLELHLALNKAIGIAANYNNISQAYYFMGDYAQAKAYLEKSRAIKEKLNDLQGLGNIYHNLGDLDVKAGDFESANENYLKALELRDSIHDKADVASSYNALGYNALRMQRPGQALNWCRQGLLLAQSAGDVEETAASADCLFQAFQMQTQADSALAYHILMTELKDSLFNQENTRKLAQLELQYAFDKERGQMQEGLKRQRMFRNVAIVITAFFFVLTFLIFRLNRMARSKNRKLHEKNQQIERDKAVISQQAEELKALDQMKSRFFTNISHELRTPLTLITTPVENLIKQYSGRLEPAMQRSLQVINQNAKKMRALVEELLELSRIDAGQQELSATATSVSAFCRQLFIAYSSAAGERGIQYELIDQLPDNTILLIDKRCFSKIINNLIGNALKFTGKGGAVTVVAQHIPDQGKTEPHVAWYQIQVKDTGRGIPPEDLPHVFDRFFQTKRENLPLEGGTGIGLALSKELAELMNGSLSVESSLGKGSTFTFTFPAQSAKAHEALPPAASVTNNPAEGPAGGANAGPDIATTGQLLIVEDNTDMRALFTDLLSDDFNLKMVNNGQEAWDLLQTDAEFVSRLDLILSDVMMPEMDGYTLLGKLKETPRLARIPVIMITARADEKDKLQALRMGVDDYLTKPFSPGELVARARNLILHLEQRRNILADERSKLPNPDFENIGPAEQNWLRELEEKTIQAVDQKVPLSASSLADKMSISERQLRRRIKAATGLAINAYINEVKLQKARQLLENQSLSTIAETAYACGFNTPGYFTKVYEQRFGKRPAEYFEE